jgi:hypothetical protein
MVRIKAMFHKVSVEHKSTAIGTATNVPRKCSTEQGKAHSPAKRTFQANDSNYIAGMARMNMFVWTLKQYISATLRYDGGGG